MLVEIFSTDNSRRVLNSIDGLIRLFPKIILMPTIKGAVGIMTINRGMDRGIYIFGLVKNNPVDFFNHDLGHTSFALFMRGNKDDLSYRIIREIGRQKETLPPKKRRNVELVYWILEHESVTDQRSLEGIIKSVTHFYLLV